MNRRIGAVALTLAAFLTVGCSTLDGLTHEQDRGTGLGLVAGGAVGHQVGSGKGRIAATAVGAVVGGVWGFLIGDRYGAHPAAAQCYWCRRNGDE